MELSHWSSAILLAEYKFKLKIPYNKYVYFLERGELQNKHSRRIEEITSPQQTAHPVKDFYEAVHHGAIASGWS